jgi:hypothetical protein
MTAEDDRRLEAYLWDPAAPPHADVDVIAKRLASARFDVARRPLTLPAQPAPRRYRRPLLAMAASLALLVAGGGAYWSWRWSWPAGAPWPVSVDARSPAAAGVASELQLDRPLQLGAAAAQVRIARIGTMRVEAGSVITLTETASTRHRVVLDRGAVSVRVWAPPARFAFRTPAGNVIDLGCVFDLSVDAAGTSRVRVATGWVQLENGWGETLVPAGASSLMTPAARPGVPVFDDAPRAFVMGVRTAEGTDDIAARAVAIDNVVRLARPRDVLTLLTLARTSPDAQRRRLLDRAAQLIPPPPDVTVDAIVGGDWNQLWRWSGTLDLPPAKGWLRNWRDALPRLR